ncbi:uncharacterized protein L969DRAFT_103373 [Mixia osmundae IAM 14324]|nr:uncharacterized protein L969DRAFT_103373 [Mixia osmundae IAM 14324]KEI39454.1 hypothetical protein L969DRAFT_103373 [Mixia osmundae IAM 14324]
MQAMMAQPPSYSVPAIYEAPGTVDTAGVLINIAPAPSAVGFQKGLLGCTPASLLGEVQIKASGVAAKTKRILRVAIVFRGTERADGVEDIELCEQRYILWDGSAPSTSTTARPEPSLPSAVLPFECPMTSDLPHCCHFAHSSLVYSLTAEVSLEGEAPLQKTLPVHLARTRPASASIDTMSFSGASGDEWRGQTCSAASASIALSHPIVAQFGLNRTLFTRSEPIKLTARIPPPDSDLIRDKRLKLRSVSAELVREVRVRASPTRSSKAPELPILPVRDSDHQVVMSRSGKSCRFSSDRDVFLRLWLQAQPLDVCETVTQSTILHDIDFHVNILIGLDGRDGDRIEWSCKRRIVIVPDRPLHPAPRTEKQRLIDGNMGGYSRPDLDAISAAIPTYSESSGVTWPADGDEAEFDGYEDASAGAESSQMPPPTIHDDEPPPSVEGDSPSYLIDASTVRTSPNETNGLYAFANTPSMLSLQGPPVARGDEGLLEASQDEFEAETPISVTSDDQHRAHGAFLPPPSYAGSAQGTIRHEEEDMSHHTDARQAPPSERDELIKKSPRIFDLGGLGSEMAGSRSASSSRRNSLNSPPIIHGAHQPHRATSPPLKSALKHSNLSTPDTPATSSAYNLPVEAALPQDGSVDTSRLLELARQTKTPANSLSEHTSGTLSPSSHHPAQVQGYERRVGFDTFDAEDETSTGGGTGVDFSFTLQVKSLGYTRGRDARTFLVATDLNEYSVHALEWTLNALTDDGDEVVVLRVIEPGTSAYAAWRQSQEEAKREAQTVLESVMRKNGQDRQLSIILEFVVGRVQSTIQRMLEIYRPDSLVVGTRGRSDSVWRSAFLGSSSRYCVATSPVPVIVVRPEDKVREGLRKRQKDPNRRGYSSLMDPDQPQRVKGTPLAHNSTFSSNSVASKVLGASKGKDKHSKELRIFKTQ